MQDLLPDEVDTDPDRQRSYVVFRTTSHGGEPSRDVYHVPGEGVLDPAEFNVWLTSARRTFTVIVLVIKEARDAAGVLQGCILERRRDTADGPHVGDPARVEITGAAQDVRAWRSIGGNLEAVAPLAGTLPDPLTRGELFAGEERALRAHYGEAVRIVAVRGPGRLEELAGFSTIVHVRTQDDSELACAIGWHGTTPFLIEGEFARIGEAEGRRLTLHPDQATWLHYAETYEDRIILEVRAIGTSDDILVLTGDGNGGIVWHMIDSDGVELWRKAPDHLMANDDLPPAVAEWLARRA